LQLESGIPGDDAAEMVGVDIGAECDCEPYGDLAVPKTGRFMDHQDTPHEVSALGHTRLQQVLRGHERRHARNVDVLGGIARKLRVVVNYRSTAVASAT